MDITGLFIDRPILVVSSKLNQKKIISFELNSLFIPTVVRPYLVSEPKGTFLQILLRKPHKFLLIFTLELLDLLVICAYINQI